MRYALVALMVGLTPGSVPTDPPSNQPATEADGEREASSACEILPNGVVVEIGERRLHLCQDGQSDASYPVNLGQGGHGKTKQGDQKTPLGRYALGAPRKSFSGFTWFVPVGYPTRQQRKDGYTGGSIGIHGPPEWLPQAAINLAFSSPWTDGCIMVRTKTEIEEIRAWLLAHKTNVIEIIPPTP